MYIPTSFFSSQGACISASVTYITGSGNITSGSFVSGGVTWDYWQFNNTLDPVTTSSVNLDYQAQFNVLSGSTVQAKLFLVAGGGAGGYGACVLAPSSCNSTAAGGGGGGGIVYYNNFTLASGSYNITVGAGGGNPLNGGIQGRQGRNTTFTYNIPYTPFTSNILTAYGGGKGGYIVNDGYGGTSFVAGASGGSAGGTVVCSNGNGAGQIIQACCDGLGGLNGANQGNDALGGLGSTGFQGTGGGGAGTVGAQTNASTGQFVSVGGDGVSYNLTGTTLTYAAGGGGVRGQGFPVINQKANNGSGTAGFGNGGQGQTLSYAQGTTATNGVVIIAIPRCLYPVIPPIPPAPIKPNILSGSSLTAWQWAPNYTPSATTWSDSNMYNNTAQFRSGSVSGTAVSMSVSSSSSDTSIVFNNNRMVYQTYPMIQTPTTSFSLNVYGEFNSGSSYYPLFANANSNDGGWDFTLIRSGSTPYISYKTTYSPGPGLSSTAIINTSLLDTNIFTGSNLLTINVITNAANQTGSIDVYLNGVLNASSISASYLRTYTDGLGNNQFGLSYSFDTSYITLNNANIKDTMIYNRRLTQPEILSNYNALTSSV